MALAVVESCPMPRNLDSGKSKTPARVRVMLTAGSDDERRRLKSFCVRIGANMETLGWQWVMERLAQEERKLAKSGS